MAGQTDHVCVSLRSHNGEIDSNLDLARFDSRLRPQLTRNKVVSFAA